MVSVSSMGNHALPVVMRVNVMSSMVSVRSIEIRAPFVFTRLRKVFVKKTENHAPPDLCQFNKALKCLCKFYGKPYSACCHEI